MTRVEHGLRELLLDDKPVFDRAFGLLKRPISDYTFAATWIWGKALGLAWKRIERHLCVFSDEGGEIVLLMPPIPEAGATLEETAACLRQCLAMLRDLNEEKSGKQEYRIEYVSDELLERIREAGEETLGATPIWGDYVYDTRRMIDLAGGDLKSKRRARNHFVKAYPDHTIEPFVEADARECLDLLGLWSELADMTHGGQLSEERESTKVMRDRERAACERAIRSWNDLGLRGLVVRVAGRVVAFSLGEPLSASQASILIEKAHPDYDGAAQLIYSEACGRLWSEYPEINAGDDWGVPTLRFTKQTYRPTRMLNKCVLAPAPAPVMELPRVNPPHTVTDNRGEPTSGAYTIRQARPEDRAGILAVEGVSFDKEQFTEGQVRGLLGNERAIVLVAEFEGRVVGWVVGLLRWIRHAKSGGVYRLGRLYSLAVHPEFRGRGIARSLARTVLERMGEAGARRISLEVRSENAPAIALYRELGFVETKALPSYYGGGREGLRMGLVWPGPEDATDNMRGDVPGNGASGNGSATA